MCCATLNKTRAQEGLLYFHHPCVVCTHTHHEYIYVMWFRRIYIYRDFGNIVGQTLGIVVGFWVLYRFTPKWKPSLCICVQNINIYMRESDSTPHECTENIYNTYDIPLYIYIYHKDIKWNSGGVWWYTTHTQCIIVAAMCLILHVISLIFSCIEKRA